MLLAKIFAAVSFQLLALQHFAFAAHLGRAPGALSARELDVTLANTLTDLTTSLTQCVQTTDTSLADIGGDVSLDLQDLLSSIISVVGSLAGSLDDISSGTVDTTGGVKTIETEPASGLLATSVLSPPMQAISDAVEKLVSGYANTLSEITALPVSVGVRVVLFYDLVDAALLDLVKGAIDGASSIIATGQASLPDNAELQDAIGKLAVTSTLGDAMVGVIKTVLEISGTGEATELIDIARLGGEVLAALDKLPSNKLEKFLRGSD